MAPSLVPSGPPVLAMLLILLVSFPLLSAFTLVGTGSTLSLNSIPYYIPATPFATIDPVSLNQDYTKTSSSGLLPVTVVNVKEQGFGVKELGDVVSGFANDDVWEDGFLGAVLVQYASSISARPKLASTYPLTLTGNSTSSVITISSKSTEIPSGPYFISASGSLYQPLRLYPDFSGAFTQPLIPGPDSSYIALPASIPGISQTVGVPSHLYYTKTVSKPLAGVRLGVKDIYDLKGQRTSDGNRAFYALFPPRTVTAPAVQRLIDAGAIIVGKMKTSQFANGETATADWVDYHSPFNPRGDGYQDPSSSSSGAGSGEGSYPWLDLALGSDTGGSIRGPAQVQGVFGNRPSHGLVELTNVMPLAPELDTAGFLCRDAEIWAAAGKTLYTGLKPYTAFPKKLLVLDFPAAPDTTANAILLKFLGQLEKFLGVKSTSFNLTSAWAASKPNAALPPLTEFLNTTYPTFISKEETKNVRDPFYKAYGAVHDGRTPFVDPVPLLRWAYGDSLPASALTDAIANKTIFMNWWTTNVLRNNSDTCTDSLLLYFVPAETHYRNQYTAKPGPPFGFDNTEISIFSEDPDMVVTLGSSPYNSTVTNHVEFLPVSVNIMAAKGCDGVIFDLVTALQKEGIITNPKAGGTITGAEVLLRRDF